MVVVIVRNQFRMVDVVINATARLLYHEELHSSKH